MLLHRHPGLWRPQSKPPGGFAAWELDPSAKLGDGLGMAMIPDGPQGIGMLLDYACRDRTYTYIGQQNFGVGQYGAWFDSDYGASNQIQFSPAIGANVGQSGQAFSFSFLTLTNGTGNGDYGNAIISASGTGTEYAMVHEAGSALIIGNDSAGTGVASTVIFMANLTGWQRLGATVNGTAVRFFLNGQFTDAQTLPAPLVTGGSGAPLPPPNSILGSTIPPGFTSWGWPVADLFFWNRTLHDNEMATNFQFPYRSVLRPRFPESPFFASGRHPGGLLTTGVGP